MNSDAASFATDGCCMVPGLLSDDEVACLLGWIALNPDGPKPRAGRRDLGGIPKLDHFLRTHPGIKHSVNSLLGDGAFPVRILFFDKTPAANWLVPWHQDLAIAVAERREAAGFSGWSEKDGIAHVQPPAAVLEAMLTLRLHLDDCGPDAGPLRVLPGTHRFGRLTAEQIARETACGGEITCLLPRGGALLMRPLLLHSSSKARRPGHRRVLHVEFAAEDLPGDLCWRSRARRPCPTLPRP